MQRFNNSLYYYFLFILACAVRCFAMEESSLENTKSYFQVPPFEGTLTINPTLERIKALADYSNPKEAEKNLEHLYIMANILVAAGFAFKEIKSAMEYDKGALATNQTADIKGFYFVEDADKTKMLQQKGLDATLVDIEEVSMYRNYVPIVSTRGKAALARFMPMLKKDSPIYALERNLIALNESANDRKLEVATIAIHVKNQLCQKSRTESLFGTCLWLFYPLLCLEQIPNVDEWQTREIFKDIRISCELLESKDYYSMLCNWLEKRDALATVQDTMAPLLWTYRFLNAVTKHIKVEPVNYNVVLDGSAQVHFSKTINSALSELDPYFQKCNKLYEAVMSARSAILMRSKNKKKEYMQKTTKVFLNLKNDQEFLRLPIKLHISDDNHEAATFTVQPQKEKKQKSKSGQKRHHKRHNKRKTIQEPVAEKPVAMPQEKPKKKIVKIIPQKELIHYAPRIERWFNGTMDAASAESKFYHTFCPWADEIMIRYGRKENVPNKTNPHLMDTCYSMDGEVHYKDGKKVIKVIVRYHCVIGPDDICYHRGMDVFEYEKVMDILSGSYKYVFPKLGGKKEEDDYSELNAKAYSISGLNSDFYGISEYKEDNLCFYLKESRDKRVKRIVLFKPYIE